MDQRFGRRAPQRYPGRGPSFAQGRRPGRIEKKADRPEWDHDREINIGTISDFMKEHWMIITIVLIGISLRIMFLNHESVWIDEALTGLRSRWDFEYMWDEVTQGDQMPLYFIFTWLVARTFGNSVLVLRGLSVIFGTLAFIPVYKIGRRFSRETGLIALLLFSLSPTMIYYSQEARMYMLMVLLSGFSTYYYLEFLDPQKMFKRSTGAIMIVLNVILIYIHYFGALFVSIQLLAMFSTLLYRSLRAKEGLQLKENTLGCWPQFVSLILWVPWLIFQQREHTIVDKKTGGSLGLGIDLIPETYRFIGGQYTAIFRHDTNIALITGYIFMIIFLISTIYLVSTRKKDHYTVSFIILGLIMMFLSPLLIHYVSNNHTPMYNHRYFIFFAVPFFLFISLAITKLLDFLKVRDIRKGPMAILIVGFLVIPSIMTDVDQLSIDDKPDWKAGVDLILKNQKEEDVVIPFPDYEQMVIYYYTDEIRIQLISRVEDRSNFIEDHYRVWVIFNVIEDMDKYPLIQDLNEWEMEEFTIGDIIVRLYVKQFQLEQDA